jgi:hypothetical protein
VTLSPRIEPAIPIRQRPPQVNITPCGMSALEVTLNGDGNGDGNSAELRRQERVREHAVRDVIERGMSVVSAAALWGLKAADLQRWVDTARGDEQNDS